MNLFYHQLLSRLSALFITFTVIIYYLSTTPNEWRKPSTLFHEGFKITNNDRSIISTTTKMASNYTNDEAGMTINDEQIRDDLIDFAIIGFPKCSTTFLRKQLLNIPSHVNFGNNESEIHLLNNNQVQKFASLYWKDEEINDGKKRKNAFKCPDLLYSPTGLYNLQKYFPQTKLIISVRHPVLWFQSFYNYRIRNGYKLPPASKLIGKCRSPIMRRNKNVEFEMFEGIGEGVLKNDPKERFIPDNIHHGVCTDRSRFHYALSQLGKTKIDSYDEEKLLKNRSRDMFSFQRYENEGYGNVTSSSFSNTKVFLMELGQLDVDNMTEADTFISDLEKFIGLEVEYKNEDTSAIIINNSTFSPATKNEKISEEVMSSWNHVLPRLSHHEPKHGVKQDMNYETIENRLINICSNEYEMLRSELVQIGHEASEWIENFFLKSPHVEVSNRASFIKLLQNWKIDPCYTIIS